jgi:tetratricopeptide (TPR) repeat protein
MSRKLRAISALLCAAALAPAETRWIHIRSADFEMYSTAAESAARSTLRYFEQVLSFFLQTTQHAPAHPLPVYIVAFTSEREYAPYRLNSFAEAYYHPGAERDYIVLGRAGAETFPVATHEYVHLVVQHAGLKFPPWLNEGLAELYSTLQPLGDKVIVGTLIPGRVQALSNEKWVPLAVILGASHDSPYYNEKNKAGSLYNEGWALVHMLSLSAEYRPKFTALLAAIQDGAPSIDALEKIYGKPLAAIEKDLQAYLRGDRFAAVAFPAKLDKDKTALPVEPAAAFDVKFALADLTNVQGKESDARKEFEELTRDDPNRPEPWSALAYMAWRSKGYAAAIEDFSKAFERGARGPTMLWDYGRMAERANPEEAVRALAELVALEPERTDARVELAAAQINAKQAVKALLTLNEIKKVSSEEAPRVFTLFAYAQIQLGMREDALKAVARLAQYAKTPEDRSQAERLKSYLDGPAGPPPLIASATPADLLTPEDPPRLVRREQTSEVESAPRFPSVSGSLVELNCMGETALVAIDTAQGRKTFLIADPTKVAVIGRDGGKVDFECGPQKPMPVKIDYSPNSSTTPTVKGADGVVRALYFDPQ